MSDDATTDLVAEILELARRERAAPREQRARFAETRVAALDRLEDIVERRLMEALGTGGDRLDTKSGIIVPATASDLLDEFDERFLMTDSGASPEAAAWLEGRIGEIARAAAAGAAAHAGIGRTGSSTSLNEPDKDKSGFARRVVDDFIDEVEGGAAPEVTSSSRAATAQALSRVHGEIESRLLPRMRYLEAAMLECLPLEVVRDLVLGIASPETTALRELLHADAETRAAFRLYLQGLRLLANDGQPDLAAKIARLAEGVGLPLPRDHGFGANLFSVLDSAYEVARRASDSPSFEEMRAVFELWLFFGLDPVRIAELVPSGSKYRLARDRSPDERKRVRDAINQALSRFRKDYLARAASEVPALADLLVRASHRKRPTPDRHPERPRISMPTSVKRLSAEHRSKSEMEGDDDG